jgi:hypothetical protein
MIYGVMNKYAYEWIWCWQYCAQLWVVYLLLRYFLCYSGHLYGIMQAVLCCFLVNMYMHIWSLFCAVVVVLTFILLFLLFPLVYCLFLFSLLYLDLMFFQRYQGITPYTVYWKHRQHPELPQFQHTTFWYYKFLATYTVITELHWVQL